MLPEFSGLAELPDDPAEQLKPRETATSQEEVGYYGAVADKPASGLTALT